MTNKTSGLSGGTEGFKHVIKIVLEILVPVLFCLLALNFIFMREFVKTLGISEHTDKIIRIDLIVIGASFIMVSAAVINMTMKVISPSKRKTGAVLPPTELAVLDQREEPKDRSCDFANSTHKAETADVTAEKNSLENTSSVRELTVKESNTTVASQAEELRSCLENLRRLSVFIEDATKEVEDTAHKANVLALNAAVEAVRGGVSGEGFGLVADEIKKLAAGSSKAAADFTSLLNGSINRAINALETGRDVEPTVSNTDKNSCLPPDLISVYDVDRAVRAENIKKIKLNLLYMPK